MSGRPPRPGFARRKALLLLSTAMPGLTSNPARAGCQADRLLVRKGQRVMCLMAGDVVLRTFPIALGGDPIGHNPRRGDRRTPEGRYLVDGRNPNSRFHLSLHLSYPNAEDRRRAVAAGLDPGGDIAIHGLPLIAESDEMDPARFYEDWTDGCIAVGNRAIEELWGLIPDGFPVVIEA